MNPVVAASCETSKTPKDSVPATGTAPRLNGNPPNPLYRLSS
jgi:hypothetical protein